MSEGLLNVWVVDDDQSVRWVLEKALRQAGMEARTFERAEHLLEAIAHGEPDVLITDVRMPGMSGITLLDRLREQAGDAPDRQALAPLLRAPLPAIREEAASWLAGALRASSDAAPEDIRELLDAPPEPAEEPGGEKKKTNAGLRSPARTSSTSARS